MWVCVERIFIVVMTLKSEPHLRLWLRDFLVLFLFMLQWSTGWHRAASLWGWQPWLRPAVPFQGNGTPLASTCSCFHCSQPRLPSLCTPSWEEGEDGLACRWMRPSPRGQGDAQASLWLLWALICLRYWGSQLQTRICMVGIPLFSVWRGTGSPWTYEDPVSSWKQHRNKLRHHYHLKLFFSP